MRARLRNTEKGLFWDYIFEKSYEFDHDHNYPLRHTAFAMEEVPTDYPPPLWKLKFFKNGNEVNPRIEVVEKSRIVELKSFFDPPLKKGDQLLVREKYQPPYFAPIHQEQNSCFGVRVGADLLDGYDGCLLYTSPSPRDRG